MSLSPLPLTPAADFAGRKAHTLGWSGTEGAYPSFFGPKGSPTAAEVRSCSPAAAVHALRGVLHMVEFAPPEEMDDDTLAAAWTITDEGRQYDGVEEDRRAIGREMASRLGENDD